MSASDLGPEDRDSQTVHPATQLAEVVHQRARLGILSVLSECGRADFTYLKSLLQLTDGNLGRHLEVLADEGLISVTKGFEGRRPRTWAEITSTGEAALAVQMKVMKELVQQFEGRRSVRSGARTRRRRDSGSAFGRDGTGAPAAPRLARS
jgi:DNA-binding HxlR family transcriptional regulator